MNPGHPAWSKEKDIESDVTNIPHSIIADNKRGKGGRLGFNESLLDAED